MRVTQHLLVCVADNLAVALRWQGQPDAEFEDVALIVANLIHLKYVKGYISHNHRKLVLAKKGTEIMYDIERSIPATDWY